MAGAGVGACASACELIAATAQAASVIETIKRIIFSLLKFVVVVVVAALARETNICSG